MAITTDTLFLLLQDSESPIRRKNTNGLTINTDVVSKQDILQGFLYDVGEYSREELYNRAFGIIYSTTLNKEDREKYLGLFLEYFTISNTNKKYTDPSPNGSISGFMDKARTIKDQTTDYFDSLYGYKGDVSQIGFYNILESDTVLNMPTIIPSSISIQEQLLNQPVPVVRSKSVGVIPDHRSRHIISLDILYPNFEAFSTTQKNYPSFINLLNMFKFMPINSIYSSILTAAFVSEYTFPKLYDLVKQVFTKEEFSELDQIKTEKAKVEHIVNQLGGAKDLSISEIKELFSVDDVKLDIGLSSIADSILSAKESQTGRKNDLYYNEGLKDFISDYDSSMGFPVPVAFKSASVQSHADMPGAIIARFAFGIISSSAFPYGSIMYRDDEGKPTYDPSKCYYGKKYVKIASEKLFGQTEKDINHIAKVSKDVNLEPLGLNDLRLYYFDFEDGVIMFDTANPRYGNINGPGVVLEKISGAFNTKSVEVPLMGSKFPSVQYMGMNSNACQLIFNVTDKQVIADFMALKARLVASEKNQTMHHSYAIVENAFINSLGISRITPQSIAIDSDPDVPDLYRLTINFMENYQDIGVKEKLKLEKGVQSSGDIRRMWAYFYDLYLIWYAEKILKVDSDSPLSGSDSEKLNNFMDALGIKAHYHKNYNEELTVLNPGRSPHDVYYGPLFMGIVEEYAKTQGKKGASGYLDQDFPEILSHISATTGRTERDFIHLSLIHMSQRNKTLRNLLGFPQEYTTQAGRNGNDRAFLELEYKRTTTGLFNFLFGFRTEELTGNRIGGLDNFAHSKYLPKNLVDMFHKTLVPIPRNIWMRTIDAILKRTYTRGNHIMVSYEQMDDAFALLYTIISEYQNSFKFNITKNNKGDEISELRGPNHLAPTITVQTISNLYDEKIARLNLSEIRRNIELIDKVNNQIIDLYPDLYLPTYGQLIQGEEGKGDPEVFAFEFLKVFGPKHGDSGTVPKFEDFKQMELSPKEISAMTSATMDHFIDPDIFYFRQRDKNHMTNAVKSAEKNKKETGKIIQTGNTIKLPANYSRIQSEIRMSLGLEDEAILNNDPRIIAAISSAFELAVSDFNQLSQGDGVISPDALQSFSSLGIQIDETIAVKLKEMLKAMKGADAKDESRAGDKDRQNIREIVHLEVITNDGQLIGEITPAPGTKYRVIPNARVGETPTYYSNVGNLSFASDDKHELQTSERTLLHTPDLSDSVLKSFPTIRVYFIEEDREHSYMQDDFYGFSEVIECNITSHLYDNDVCRMKLANFSGVLTTMQFSGFEDSVEVKSSSDNPEKNQPNNAEVIKVVDDAKEKFLRKVMLRPGVHIMVKLGYGNNLDTIPTVFTGEIAEIKPGPIVELVAQGYQTELHNEFGGFMEEGFWETGAHALLDNKNLKFGFMKIINFILLENGNQNKRLSRNNMTHLGDPFSVRSHRKGFFGKIDPNYSYNKINSITQILGEYRTQEDFLADVKGETFSWFDSWLESTYFGLSGTDVTRNIYVATSNNSDINVAQEWLITNAPVVDSLREVTRYMPNFICTVVPYEQDATLFIGDPCNIYQYRKPTKKEQEYNVKIDKIRTGLKNQDLYRTLNSDVNRIVKEINGKVLDLRKRIDAANAGNCAPRNVVYDLNQVLFDSLTQHRHIHNHHQTTIVKTNISVLKGIKDDVKAKLFCNYFRIEYDKNEKDTYLDILSDLLEDNRINVESFKIRPRKMATASPHGFSWTPDTNRDPDYQTRFIKDFMPLNNYPFEKEQSLPGINNLEKHNKGVAALKKKMSELFKRSTVADYEVNLINGRKSKDIIFGLGKPWFAAQNVNVGERPYIVSTEVTQREVYADSDFALTPRIHLKLAFYLLDKMKTEKNNYLERLVSDLVSEGSSYNILNTMPWQYKVFRDHHVLSTEHDLIANNLAASETDMWSAVALRVPQDTVEEINGALNYQGFSWGIEEGGFDATAGTYRIDSDQTFGIFPNKLSGGVNFKGYSPGPKDILENFTEINATTPSLAQNALKFRLAQGMSKMYRGNLICMGRNIKPYDQVQIMDNVNNMYGKVMVERVVQHFSSTTGWTTTIVPCALTRVNSKQASYNITESDKWLYTLSQGKTGRYLMNALTIATFASAPFGLLGGAKFLGQSAANFIPRLFSGVVGRSIDTLWKAAKSPYIIGKRIARSQNTLFAQRFAARFGFNPITGGSGQMLTFTGVKGVSGVKYQFNNMQISQTKVLVDGTNVHQPCHMSLITYNGTPFISGLEDPLSTMSNIDCWSQLLEDFDYAWREWISRSRPKLKANDVLSQKNLTPGGE